jgi:hypothetical protein
MRKPLQETFLICNFLQKCCNSSSSVFDQYQYPTEVLPVYKVKKYVGDGSANYHRLLPDFFTRPIKPY